MTDVFCHRCGHRNPGDANFCSSCGAALPVSGSDLTLTFSSLDQAGEVHEPDVTVHIEHFAGGPGVLIVKRGADAGTRYDLVAERTGAGRNLENPIFLDDVSVSRRHAEIVRDATGTYSIRDLGSLNGTYVNRVRITESPLANGDEVQIGKFRLVFLAAE